LTAIVGIICSDGIVISTDSSATFGPSLYYHTIEQPHKKIEIIGDKVIIAGTGEIGLGQRFCNIIFKELGELNGKQIPGESFFKVKHPEEAMRNLAQKTIQNFHSTNPFYNQPGNTVGFNYGALIAYTHGDDLHLCEFDPVKFQPELKFPDHQKIFFSSMGSGQQITDPFLGLMRRIFWKQAVPTVAEAKLIAVWTLQHAIDLNTGGINRPIQMALIKRNEKGKYSASYVPGSEIHEHMDGVAL
jgi:hypothetical protein